MEAKPANRKKEHMGVNHEPHAGPLVVIDWSRETCLRWPLRDDPAHGVVGGPVRSKEEAVPNHVLASLREGLGLSQEEVADRLNEMAGEETGSLDCVTKTTVSRWERGAIDRPHPARRRRLAKLFGVKLSDLGWGAQQPPDPAGGAQASERLGGDRPAGSADATRPLDARVARSQQDWLRTRRLLNEHRHELTQLAQQLYPVAVRLGQTGFLSPPEWRLNRPIDLRAIELAWESAAPIPVITGEHQETRAVRPLLSSERRYDRYHTAMRDLDRPRLFENRLSHRLLGVDWAQGGGGGRLTFGHMRYFDMIDIGEALAHEFALAAIDADGTIAKERPSWKALPFRRSMRDPFNLSAYPLLLSISTLTIRLSPAGATFVLLRRGKGRVAIAGGMLSVMPTGVFQPASILPAPNSPDFDLWRNMMREYSEEFLGNPEHDGNGDPIDYANQEPFRSLNQARRAGKIRVFCLGAGIDALNNVGDVLTVAVFDADVFDRIFDGLVDLNDEGTVESMDADRQQFAFDRQTVRRLLADEPWAPSGAATLQLAWHHRAALLAQ
jgi:transcriptional regulator with XRE-family HTH domain